MLALRGELYVLGGFDDEERIVSVVEAYDPATDTWRRAADLPTALHHANAAVVDDRLFVLGFLTDRSFSADGRVFVYDPDLDAWGEGRSLPPFTERGGSGVAVVDDRVYVVGGYRGGAVTDVSRYDPATDAWEVLPSLPVAADHLVAGAVLGVVYAVGGRSGGIGGHRPAVWAFHPDAGGWIERASMPTSRAGAAATTAGGLVYVFGGEGNRDDESGVFAQAEAYDPDSDTWERLAPMPTPRHGMGAATIDGIVYVPGGGDLEGFAAVDTHEAYLP